MKGGDEDKGSRVNAVRSFGLLVGQCSAGRQDKTTEINTEIFKARPGGAAAAPVWARPLLLKVLLWAVLLALFAELELGLPYFVLSLLYWMYAGTRGPAERRRGELSAYSVFNPGCTAIAGTLTAEQLERELYYRPAAGR
ncbi:say domain-containing protein 1 [Limosa lapponica baueri]|uniref:Say domain-containing protein 1 n=1 Tax=Limosa lapponica baueri TaxID=1758121 RepID=A0A2I0UMA6_LIMLA|nr:say domain-containing protein 1 [Limosa lapponica baueri]